MDVENVLRVMNLVANYGTLFLVGAVIYRPRKRHELD